MTNGKHHEVTQNLLAIGVRFVKDAHGLSFPYHLWRLTKQREETLGDTILEVSSLPLFYRRP